MEAQERKRDGEREREREKERERERERARERETEIERERERQRQRVCVCVWGRVLVQVRVSLCVMSAAPSLRSFCGTPAPLGRTMGSPLRPILLTVLR